jgi:hypothetical protein
MKVHFNTVLLSMRDNNSTLFLAICRAFIEVSCPNVYVVLVVFILVELA